MIALGIFVYVTMARYTGNIAKSRISGRGQLLAAVLNQDYLVYRQFPFPMPPLETLEDEETMVQVLGQYGNVLAPSPRLGLNDIPVPPSVLETASQGALVFYRTTIEGTSYDVGILPFATQASGEPWGFVQVARSERIRALTLSQLLLTLIIGGAVSVAASWLMSWLTARTALKPIRETIETARAIALSRSFGRKLTPRHSLDELGQMVTAFNEMLKSLEEAQAAQQRFVADASHELRAPLTVIRGNLDLLERAKDRPPLERAEILEAARAEVERMSRLVADLLSLARADSETRLQTAEVELDSVVLEIYEQLLAGSPHVRLSLSGLGPLRVLGDRDRLKQLVLILVDNAIRYTPAGGSVTLSLRSKGTRAILAVADTGIGIDPADRPRLFERFYRSQRAREMDPGGTGLGLAIARWIVDDHGGELDLRSTPGQGTIATLRLPLLC